MGTSTRVYLDKEEFEKKLKESGTWELEEILYFLLLLDNLIQGKSFHVFESFITEFVGHVPVRDIKTFQDFKNLINHYFYFIYEEDVIEYEENLKSDVAKDLFGYIYKEWSKKMVLFIVEHSLIEDSFIPFSLFPDTITEEEFRKMSDKRVVISLNNAIREVVRKLYYRYKEEEN